jgi:hypothetical protein
VARSYFANLRKGRIVNPGYEKMSLSFVVRLHCLCTDLCLLHLRLVLDQSRSNLGPFSCPHSPSWEKGARGSLYPASRIAPPAQSRKP